MQVANAGKVHTLVPHQQGVHYGNGGLLGYINWVQGHLEARCPGRSNRPGVGL
jgi:hypothetical protein